MKAYRSFHLLLALAALTAVASLSAETATGVVFHDENGNSARDSGEPGIESVLVSNGTEVVKTDAQGRYALPVTSDTILFVIQPQGWQVPVDAFNRPQFYYLHKPEGSPELDYPGSAPTGPLPESVDFALHEAPQSEDFRMLLFGDPQTYSMEDVDYLARSTVAELTGVENVAAGLVLGDIVGDKLELFEPISETIGRIGLPFWYVYGNHDMNFDAPTDRMADETFEATYGPATYAFQIGRTHFLVLDDVIYPYDGPQKYMGGLREDQFTFVENLLAHVPTDDLVVLAMHIPLEDFGDTFRTADRKRLFGLLAGHPKTLSLSAHTHKQNHFFYTGDDGWPHDTPHHHYNVGTTSGSWWQGPAGADGVPESPMRDGTPKGYAFLGIDGNDYTLRYKVTGAPADKQMRLFLPRAIGQGGWWPGFVIVNVFNGEPSRTRVEWRLNEGDWKKMTHSDTHQDPGYTARMLDTWRAAHPPEGKPLPAPDVCTHLWHSRLPPGLPEGVHTVTVRVSDPYGAVFTESSTFRVQAE